MSTVRCTIAIRGKVGRFDLAPGPWLEGLEDRLRGTRDLPVAYIDDAGQLRHGTANGATAQLFHETMMLTIDVAIDDAELPPPPHGGLA